MKIEWISSIGLRIIELMGSGSTVGMLEPKGASRLQVLHSAHFPSASCSLLLLTTCSEDKALKTLAMSAPEYALNESILRDMTGPQSKSFDAKERQPCDQPERCDSQRIASPPNKSQQCCLAFRCCISSSILEESLGKPPELPPQDP